MTGVGPDSKDPPAGFNETITTCKPLCGDNQEANTETWSDYECPGAPGDC